MADEVAPMLLGFGVANYEFVPQQLNGGVPSEAGADFGGAVWLTPARAGLLSDANLKKWISNPPALKPGTAMPVVPLTDDELTKIVAFLETLK